MSRLAVALAVAFFALMPGGVYAQDEKQAPDPHMADPHLAAALDVVQAADIAGPALKMVDKMIPEIAERVHRQSPNSDEATVKAFLDDVQQQMAASANEYTELLAQVYMKHFSEDELHQLAQFYRSDVGKKYVAETPNMAGDIQRAGVAWVGSSIAKATQNAATHFKDKGLNL